MTAPPTSQTVAQMALLLAISLAAAYGSHRFRHEPLNLRYPWSEHVTTEAAAKGIVIVDAEQTKAIVDAYTHIVLDARKTSDYHAGHLPGAMSLPAGEFDLHFPDIAILLTPEQPILVYCSGQDCDESLHLGDMLKASGFTNILLFAGGITAWQQAGYRVEQ